MNLTQLAKQTFNQCAQQYQDKFMDTTLYHDTFDLFCEKVSMPGAQILDIACGPGNVTRYLLERRPDYNILAIDIAENMIALARANNPAAQFQVMDARDIPKLCRQFAGIMCGFGLPYLSKEDAIQLIADAAALLHDNGVLYISTMEDDYSKSGLETSSSGSQLYIHYHEAGYLLDALQHNGFQVVEVRRIPFTGYNGKLSTDLVLIAQK